MTPEQLRTVLEEVTRATVPSWYVHAVFLFLAAVAGAVGAWGGSYLSERGKRYATKEDFDSILSEMRRTTQATEEIKTQIAGGLWLEQTRWQQRRDIYFALIKSLTEVMGLFEAFYAEAKNAVDSTADPTHSDHEKKIAVLQATMVRAVTAVDQLVPTMATASLILPEEAMRSLERVVDGARSARAGNTPLDALRTVADGVSTAFDELVAIARADLGMPLAQVNAVNRKD